MPSSNTLANNLLQYLFVGGTIITAPTKVYLGISTTAPNPDGTNVTEPSGNGYSRVELNCNSAMWNTTTNKQISNKSGVLFSKATENWNNHTNTTSDVLYAVLYTASTGGTFLTYSQVPYKWIQAGTEYYIDVGKLKLKMV